MTNGAHVLLSRTTRPLAGLLAAHLRAHGYRVTVAPSAEAAERSSPSASDPDLSCSTSTCPATPAGRSCGATAFEAAGRPPVIVASAMAVSPARLREFGVAGYLPKPFALDTLRSTLDRVLTTETEDGTMTDLQIALILIGCIAVFSGYLLLCERVGR